MSNDHDHEQEHEQARPISTVPMGHEITKPVDVHEGTAEALKLFEERARVSKQMLKAALSMVQPGQIVVMGATDKKTGEVKESVYITGGGADRILRFGFGMHWGPKDARFSTDPDGTETCTVTAELIKPNGEVYETFEGTRRMGGFVKNHQDLKKGAVENMKHQAATDILGTRFLTPRDFAEIGVDTAALPRRVEFQEHGKDESGAAVVEWGKHKGKKLSELAEPDLLYLKGAAEKSIADPDKAKFKASEERRLRSYDAELARRKAPPPAAAPEDAAVLEGLCVQIRELGMGLGLADNAVEAGLAKLKTVKQAQKWIDELKKRAEKGEAKREPGDDDEEEQEPD